jgi:hypothetical protein
VSVTAAPARTHAVVVGIEAYAAGPDWSLGGPAADACRVTDWLLSRGVPADQISLFLSPADASALAVPAGVAAQGATSTTISRVLTEELPKLQGDLLFLFWGGHGVITQALERRLYFADATTANKLNLDLNALLTSFRSDLYRGLPRQVCIVDACQNFAENLRSPISLPHTTFPLGRPLDRPEQFVLYAVQVGELATNLTAEDTGLFTREVLCELRAEAPDGPWPPDLEAMSKRLETRFVALRDAGEARQTPTSYEYRTWSGREVNRIGQGMRAGSGGGPVAEIRPRLRARELARLTDLLYDMPSLSDSTAREGVLRNMRATISGMIARSPYDRVHLTNILEACQRYPGGYEELVVAIRLFEREAIALRTFVDELRRMVPDLRISESLERTDEEDDDV